MSIADLIAKYNKYHGELGKFVSAPMTAIGDTESYDPHDMPEDELLINAVDAWTASTSNVDEMINAAGNIMRTGEVNSRDMYESRAFTLLQAIHNSEPDHKKLYRGGAVSDEQLVKLSRPGFEFDLPLVGYTRNEHVAAGFMASKSGWHPTEFVLEGSHKSLAADLAGGGRIPEEKEHITGGRFRVKNVSTSVRSNGQDILVVRLEHVATFNPEDVVEKAATVAALISKYSKCHEHVGSGGA